MTLRRALATCAAVAAVGPLAACQATPPATAASPVAELTATHYALALDLPRFVRDGDVARLRVLAEALAEEEPASGMPGGSEGLREKVREAARRAAEASEPAVAAHSVAQLAASCGACHLANDGTLGERLHVTTPSLAAPAARHSDYMAWASTLLWNGLLGPSERQWRTGAGALVGSDAFPPPRAGHVPRDEVARAAARLQDLGADAVVAPDADARADALGRIWTVCADCHVQAGIR